MADKRLLAERIVDRVIRTYHLRLKAEHVLRVIRELEKLPLSEENLLTVAKNLLDIGESYFFRDAETWKNLRKMLIRGKSYKVLSLGCAEGEEVYSFSFIAKDAGAALHIEGVDASEERIEKARNGIYPEWKLRKLSEVEIRRYFEVVEKGFKVKEKYKEGVSFRVENITTMDFGEDFDFIFARRIFIYLKPEILPGVLERVHNALKKDGFLILGKGEIYGELLDLFEPVKFSGIIFWRKKKTKGFEVSESELVDKELSEEKRSYMDIIKMFINKGMYEEALLWIQNAREAGFETPEIMKYQIVSFMYLKRENEAMKVLEEALEMFPEDEELLKLQKVIS